MATVDEGIALRENGFKEDILLLGYTAEDDYIRVIQYRLTPAIYTVYQAEALNREAKGNSEQVKNTYQNRYRDESIRLSMQ